MDNQGKNNGNPLRMATDKVKDIYNTYKRGETADSTRKNSKNNSINAQAKTMTEQEEILNQEEHTQAEASTENGGELQSALEKARAERDEFKEIAARKVAELENFRRRTEQEKKDIITYSNFKLLQTILPALDELLRAVEAGKKGSDYKALLDGVELVANKTMAIYHDAGVEPIKTVGEEFDVHLHEALAHMPSDAPEGQIIMEYQRGYMYNGKVLRHAKVVTSAGASSENE